MARILYLGTAGSDDLKGKNARSINPKVIAEKVAAIDKVVSLYGRNLMAPGLTLKSLLVGTLVVVGSAT